MKPLAPMLGQGYGPAPAPDPVEPVKAAPIATGRQRAPYRNLDVWPRARAMLAATKEPLSASAIGKALGVETKCVLNALAYHAGEVEREGTKMQYAFRLKARTA